MLQFALQRLSLPASLPAAASILASTIESIYPGGLGFLSICGAAAIVGLWWCIGILKLGNAIFNARWAKMGERALVLAVSLPLVLAGALSGDYIHLAILYPSYQHVIDTTTDRPVRFPWGDAAVSVLDGIQFRTLIYDETGAANAAVGSDRLAGEGVHVSTSHLVGNFFIEHVHI